MCLPSQFIWLSCLDLFSLFSVMVFTKFAETISVWLSFVFFIPKLVLAKKKPVLIVLTASILKLHTCISKIAKITPSKSPMIQTDLGYFFVVCQKATKWYQQCFPLETRKQREALAMFAEASSNAVQFFKSSNNSSIHCKKYRKSNYIQKRAYSTGNL